MTLYQHAPNVMHRVLPEGDTVILDPDLMNYYGASATASDVWGHFTEPKTVDDVVSALLAMYDVDPEVCREETTKFVENLVERQLLQTVSESVS